MLAMVLHRQWIENHIVVALTKMLNYPRKTTSDAKKPK